MTDYKDFAEQEMFAPAQLPILTETTEMTQAKSPKARIVNICLVVFVYAIALEAAVAASFDIGTLAGLATFAVGMLPIIAAALRIRTLQKRVGYKDHL